MVAAWPVMQRAAARMERRLGLRPEYAAERTFCQTTAAEERSSPLGQSSATPDRHLPRARSRKAITRAWIASISARDQEEADLKDCPSSTRTSSV